MFNRKPPRIDALRKLPPYDEPVNAARLTDGTLGDPSQSGDILSSRLLPPSWDASDVLKSLRALRAYAEAQAERATDWYYRSKRKKSKVSSTARFATIVLTALGGLIPIIATIVYGNAAEELQRLRFNQWGYLAIGFAGLALGFDRFYGGSSGWMRYVTTALAIESRLEEFRLDWIKIESELALRLNDQALVASAIDRIKAFVAAVRAQVESETQAWVTEFRSTLTQLEKQAEDALQAARDQAKKDLEAQLSASKAAVESVKPGGIDLTVTSPALKDGFAVAVDGEQRASGVTGKTCGITRVDPGIRQLTVHGTDANGARRNASKAVLVPANALVQVTIDLT